MLRGQLEEKEKLKISCGFSLHAALGTKATVSQPILILFFSFLQVLVTNLELEPVGHHEPANFWFGPSAVRRG